MSAKTEAFKEIIAAAKAGKKIKPMTDKQRAAKGLPSRKVAKEERHFKKVTRALRQGKAAVMEAAMLLKETPDKAKQMVNKRAAMTGTKKVAKRGNPNFGKQTAKNKLKAKSSPAMEQEIQRAAMEALEEMRQEGLLKRKPGRPSGSKNKKK